MIKHAADGHLLSIISSPRRKKLPQQQAHFYNQQRHPLVWFAIFQHNICFPRVRVSHHLVPAKGREVKLKKAEKQK